MSCAVETRDVFRVFTTAEGDAAALQGLSLTVDEGEVVAVLGPSGSGKTTLLRLLAALDQPSAGSVRVFGVEAGKLAARRRAAFRGTSIGYADQHYSRTLAAELTARELVALPLGLRGARPAARLARADELLERVGLADRRAARPGELSGGEQQRVAVCAALAHRPRLLLADEPTGELDERNAELIFGVIGELAREQSCTAVVVSHDPAAASVADRVVRIRDGRVAEEALRDGDRREDAIVLGKGGWLRLPEEYLARAGIHGRANARLEHRRIVVSPVDGDGAAPPPEPGDDGRPRLTPRPGLGAELRDVDKTFGRGPAARTVLRGLSVRLQSATLYALTGPSGSGKTTLLELLAGLQQPDAGVIVVGGEVISELARERRARLRAEHVGFVPQAPVLTPFLSARENVELALTVRGVAPQEAAERAVAALDAVGLSERLDQRVSRLSSGERGRVAIARALGGRPALLLADEPTSRLDQGNALAVAALLARLAHETGATVVCATHDPLVLEQADEQIELAGRLG